MAEKDSEPKTTYAAPAVVENSGDSPRMTSSKPSLLMSYVKCICKHKNFYLARYVSKFFGKPVREGNRITVLFEVHESMAKIALSDLEEQSILFVLLSIENLFRSIFALYSYMVFVSRLLTG